MDRLGASVWGDGGVARVPGESVPLLCRPPHQHRDSPGKDVASLRTRRSAITHQQQLLPAPPMRYWSLVYRKQPSRVVNGKIAERLSAT